MKTIYLAGPMTGFTLEDAQSWRKVATGYLEDLGWTVLDPCRAKDHMKGKVIPASGYKHGRALVARDRHDIKQADVVLFNFEPNGLQPERVSVGSLFEKAWVHEWGKLSVTIMTPGNVHEHIFVEETSPVLVPTLEEALDYIATL